MVRTKVFVGNLSFKTREAELAQEFATAGPVIGANIITRGPRSLGYGFVEFDNEEDANNAVKLMSKKEIDGRQINVEVAKPREELEQQQQNNGEGSPSRGGRGRGGFRGGRGGRGRGSSGRGSLGGNRGGATSYRRRYGDENQQEGGEQQQQQQEGQERRPRRPRARRFGGNQDQQQPQEPRTESKTTLFIANLPFALDDETFAKVFADNGLKFKSAHVVKKRNGRSKGFGFAEFDAQEDQLKALQTLHGSKVDERELIVKIALTEQQPRTTVENKQQEEVKEESKKVETE